MWPFIGVFCEHRYIKQTNSYKTQTTGTFDCRHTRPIVGWHIVWPDVEHMPLIMSSCVNVKRDLSGDGEGEVRVHDIK